VRKLTKNPVTPSQPIQGRVEACVTPQASWRTPIAAAALALVLGFTSQDAAALALGRVNVLSSLGEPLRAEIDVPEITAEEAASLRTSVANPEAFRAAGLEYNPALSTAQISLQRRANGTSFLRLSSDRTINEPFVDLILEASWASGRIVRDYTMLFDPSNMRQAAVPAATSPAASTAPAVSAPAATPRSGAPAPVAAAPRPARSEPAPKADKPAQPAPKDGISVKAGDTAAALAARYKPAGVSLDQMLVAMLRASPDAFIGGNVNRLKSGAVIDVQAAASAAPNTAEGEAKQTIVAQSKDFNEFRRRLASGAPTATAAAPSRAAGGKVQANVSEPKAQATAPDKLTLSKGSVAAKAKEEAIAKEKQAKDNAARVAELSKNIQDLNKLGTTTVAKPGAPAAAPATGAARAPGVKVAGSAPAVPAAPTSTMAKAPTPTVAAPTPVAAPVAAAASAAASAAKPAASAPTLVAAATSTVASTSTAAAPAAPAASAPAPAPVAVAKPKAPPPPPPPEPSFMESLMDNPAVLPGAGALLAGLGGLAFWRMRQRKKSTQVDSSFLESRLQPDSFFGASGGQRVDTADSGSAAGPGSSMVYSPSQLDAAGDVDPVAEADVYLAYGRDLQAEEILKEAMRTSPSRVAIHAKLMEIYAKRRDAKAFESVAKEAFNLTQGAGPEWDAASALGREMDPANPLYAQGNAPSGAGMAGSVMLGGAAVAAAGAATAAFNATSTVPQQAIPQDGDDFDIDLDLDFSAGGDDLVSAPNVSGMISAPPAQEPTVAIRAMPDPEPMVDFDMSEPAPLGGVKLSEPDMASFSNGLNFSSPSFSAPAPTAPMALKTGPSEPGALEFDLGGLSLDLPGSSASAASDAVDAGVSGDPLETKLALAMEFKDIGDADGARSLVQEVADEASGALKSRALKMLADLG
jgi:pilus assembly protein FimV